MGLRADSRPLAAAQKRVLLRALWSRGRALGAQVGLSSCLCVPGDAYDSPGGSLPREGLCCLNPNLWNLSGRSEPGRDSVPDPGGPAKALALEVTLPVPPNPALSFPAYLATFSFLLFFGGVGSTASPAAYGGSQARGQIRATPASLHHSHNNTGSKSLL